MSASETLEVTVRAGIHTEDGKLTESYKDLQMNYTSEITKVLNAGHNHVMIVNNINELGDSLILWSEDGLTWTNGVINVIIDLCTRRSETFKAEVCTNAIYNMRGATITKAVQGLCKHLGFKLSEFQSKKAELIKKVDENTELLIKKVEPSINWIESVLKKIDNNSNE